MKQCTKCGKWFLPEEVNKKGHCKICVRDYDWQRRRKISPEGYAKLFNQQNGCCAICQKLYTDEKQMLSVDHCHDTGKIRGLLCRNCNLGIGLFNEDPDLLVKAVIYLKGDTMDEICKVITKAFEVQFDALKEIKTKMNDLESKLNGIQKELDYIRKTY